VIGGVEKEKGSQTSEMIKILVFFGQLFLLLNFLLQSRQTAARLRLQRSYHLLLMTSNTVLFPPGVKPLHTVMAMLAEVLFG